MRDSLLALALASIFGIAHAGTVQILVTDKDGKPVPDVVVPIDAAGKPAPKAAAAPVVIVQEDSRFVSFLTVVPLGSTLRFTNRDAYDHHVRSTPSGPLGNTPAVSSFEFRLHAAEVAAPAGSGYDAPKPAPRAGNNAATSAEVRVDVPGAIGLGCHIHSSMRGQVYVAATPWFGKTDANGAFSIDGVPDGAADLTLWHADQLQDQPALHVQVGNTPVKTIAQLNFAPRRRRSP